MYASCSGVLVSDHGRVGHGDARDGVRDILMVGSGARSSLCVIVGERDSVLKHLRVQAGVAPEVLLMQAVAQIHPAGDAANCAFWRGVASANPRLEFASPLVVHDVGHASPPRRRAMREPLREPAVLDALPLSAAMFRTREMIVAKCL